MRKIILLEEEIIYNLGSAILCPLTFILHVLYIPFIMFLKIKKKKKKRNLWLTHHFLKRQDQHYFLFILAQAMYIRNSVHKFTVYSSVVLFFHSSVNFHKLNTVFETSSQFKKEHDPCL